MKQRKQKRGEEGVALIVVLGFLTAMAIIIGYTAARSVSHSNQLTQSIDRDESFLALDGAHRTINSQSDTGDTETYIGLPGIANDTADSGDYRFVDLTGLEPALNLPPADQDMADAEGIVWQPLGNVSNGADVSWVAMALPGEIDGLDNDGDGGVDEVEVTADPTAIPPVLADADESGYSSMFMASRTMRDGELISYRAAQDSNAPGENINIWKNAIFANIGQGGALINGNVSIHGSVHLLGNDPNAVVVAALDLGGTSFIHNSYGDIGGTDGIPADLASRIGYTGVESTMAGFLDDPSTPDITEGFTFNDDDQFSLNSDLRVKNGTIELTGNSEVGTDGTSPDEKLTMDGLYLGDGGGDEVVSGAENIYSDNGYSNAYDLGERVEFPDYNDDGGENFITERYLEGFDAQTWTEVNPDSTTTTYTNPNYNATGDRVFHGDITLTAGAGAKKTPNSNNFYWNTSESVADGMPNAGVVGVAAGTGSMPTEAQLAAKIAAGENFIWYDGNTTPPTMVVNGRVAVDGDVFIGSGTGSNDTFEYEGKGSLMTVDLDGDGTGGDMNIDASLLTTNYPTSNVMAFMSQNDFNVGGSSQLDIMGAFYAQGTVAMNFQTNIVGSVAGNFFDMGSNVPNIFQVPSLADAFTDQMRVIGSDPIQDPTRLAWREFNVRLEATD